MRNIRIFLIEVGLGIALILLGIGLDTFVLSASSALGTSSTVINIGFFLVGMGLIVRGIVGIVLGQKTVARLSEVRIEIPQVTKNNILGFIGYSIIGLIIISVLIVGLIYIFRDL